MDNFIFRPVDEDVGRDWLALLLKHFSRLADERKSWRIRYPLAEVVLPLTCATIGTIRSGTPCGLGGIFARM